MYISFDLEATQSRKNSFTSPSTIFARSRSLLLEQANQEVLATNKEAR
ncbi:hypothetical protein [Enterococcus faecalis]|nr:hypothetical protein [Enterococcus faecalis]